MRSYGSTASTASPASSATATHMTALSTCIVWLLSLWQVTETHRLSRT